MSALNARHVSPNLSLASGLTFRITDSEYRAKGSTGQAPHFDGDRTANGVLGIRAGTYVCIVIDSCTSN